MQRTILTVAAVLAGLSAAPAAAQEVKLDWNSGQPGSNSVWSGGWEVGWYFTPSQSIFVNFLGTRFGPQGADRSVVAEIRSDRGVVGGTVLASAVFNSAIARSGIGGGVFETILLEAGTTYFLGFRNVSGLGVNTILSNDPRYATADGPTMMYWSSSTNGAYTTTTNGYRPILQLQGPGAGEPDPPTVVPEPMSMLLLGTGLAGLGAARRRRRREAA